MFGIVIANREGLSEEDQKVYQRFYCGVCHSLGADYGDYCRSTLSYDMTFLAIFLQGLEEGGPEAGEERCVMRPAHPHGFYRSAATDYAAAMNVILTWYKCRDDWEDDRNLIRYGGMKVFGRARSQVEAAWPRQCEAVAEGLGAIGAMERRGETNPDRPAAAFGKIMGELFVMDEAHLRAREIRAFGDALGRFIYIMDAVVDLKEDLKKERYNPLIAMEHLEPVDLLSTLLGRCTDALAALPENRYQAIIENVLYSGVWIPYAARKE